MLQTPKSSGYAALVHGHPILSPLGGPFPVRRKRNGAAAAPEGLYGTATRISALYPTPSQVGRSTYCGSTSVTDLPPRHDYYHNDAHRPEIGKEDRAPKRLVDTPHSTVHGAPPDRVVIVMTVPTGGTLSNRTRRPSWSIPPTQIGSSHPIIGDVIAHITSTAPADLAEGRLRRIGPTRTLVRRLRRAQVPFINIDPFRIRHLSRVRIDNSDRKVPGVAEGSGNVTYPPTDECQPLTGGATGRTRWRSRSAPARTASPSSRSP